jgi:hypothetical protein
MFNIFFIYFSEEEGYYSMISYLYLISFFKGFLLTLVIELPLLFLFTKSTKLKVTKAALVSNILSLPVVWFVFPFLTSSYYAYLFSAETFAILFESITLNILLPISYKRAFLTALTINLASFLIGGMFPI